MKNEEKILLRKAVNLLANNKVEEAKFLLEETLLNKRYANFLRYIEKRNSIFNAKYTILDDKQVFTNFHSLIIMNKPFYIDMEKLTIDENLEFLKNIKDQLEREESKSSKAYFSKIFNADQEVIITSDKNNKSFRGKVIKDAISLLGANLEYSLFDEKPVLCAENENGKAYILGLNNK